MTASPPTLSAADFAAKWRESARRERAASQEHFIDLCRLLGVPTPNEGDPGGESYSFEAGAERTSTGRKPESTDRSLTGRDAGLPKRSAGVPAFAGRRRGRAGARSPRSAPLGGAEGACARVREACAGMLARASDPGPAL